MSEINKCIQQIRQKDFNIRENAKEIDGIDKRQQILDILYPHIKDLFFEISKLLNNTIIKQMSIKEYDQLLEVLFSWHRYCIVYGIILTIPDIPDLLSIEPKYVVQKTKRHSLTGVVIRKSGDKTIKVEVSTFQNHPLYHKRIVRRKIYTVHDEKNRSNIGDEVIIVSCRPMSKTKKYRLFRIIAHGNKPIPEYDNNVHSAEPGGHSCGLRTATGR